MPAIQPPLAREIAERLCRAPILSADGFAGPLDWLVEMARARKIDLARLPVATLIESFASALETALARHDSGSPPPLARWGNWLVMAATLAWLRSCLLLRRDAPAAHEAETEAEALRRLLLDRAQIRAAADWLTARPQLGHEVFARGQPATHGPGRVGDLTEPLRACLVALKVPETQVAAARPPVPRLWQVTDAMRRFGGGCPYCPTAARWPPSCRRSPRPQQIVQYAAAVATTLVAGLELARSGALRLDQDETWGEVAVWRPGGASVDQAAAASDG